MSLIGFRCPSTVPSVGRENEFDFCLYQCPHQCLPTGVLATIIRLNHGNPHKGDMVSPTALPRCPRKFKLTRTEPYHEEPPALYDATRGSLYHAFIETDGLKGILQEKRVYKIIESGPMAPWIISGQLDFFDHARKKIEDYKTLAEKGLFYLYNGGAKADHVMQLNMYRWLADGGHVAPPGATSTPTVAEVRSWPQLHLDVNELQLHYLLMSKTISTGTPATHLMVENGEPNRGKPYKYETKRKFVRQRGRMQDWLLTIDLPKVPLKPFQEVEAYAIERGPTLVRAFREPDFMPAGVLHDQDQAWECGYCPVTTRCNEIEQEAAELRFFGANEQPFLREAA